MAEPPERRDPPARARPDSSAAGLCDTCVHAEVKTSARSRFLRCALSDIDASFDRYPRLPVLACRGYRPFLEA